MMGQPFAMWRLAAPVLAAACATGGCVLLVGGSAVIGGAIVTTDRRSTGIQLEDAEIEHRINSAFEERFARESVRIDVTSYDQKVLLAGQVPSEKDRADAESIAASSQNVRRVVNELTIGSMAGLASRVDDNAVAAKVRSALLEAPGLPTGVVKVACTGGTAYLFGRTGSEEAEIAKRTASRVEGVRRVVALFDMLTDQELAQIKRDAQPGNQAPSVPADTRTQ